MLKELENKRLLVVQAQPEAPYLELELENLSKVEVFYCFGLEQTLSKLNETAPDLVLMDVQETSAKEATQFTDRIREKYDVPIVYIVSAQKREPLEKANKNNVFGWLKRPFSPKELITTLSYSLHRYRLESKLRKSEEWLSAILKCITEAVVVTDSHGIIQFLNPYAEELLNTQGKKGIGQHFSKVYRLINSEGQSVEKTAIDTALEFGDLSSSGQSVFLRQSWLTKIPVQDTAAPFLGANGESRGVVLVFRDVSEQHKANEQLVASEEKLRSLVENAPDNICLINRRGEIQFVNRPLPGYRTQDMIGRRLQAFFELGEHAKINETIKSVFENLQMGMFEANQQRSGDESIWYSSRAMPITKNGEATQALVVMRDTTGRKRAENQLAESEERYALAAQGSNDGLWDHDLVRNNVYYSPRWKEMLGFKEDEIGNSLDEWYDRVHPDDIKKLTREIEAHLGGARDSFRCEYRLLHRNGEYLWMLGRGIAVRDDKGKPYRIAGSQADITRRKLYEEQLVHDAFHDALTGLPNRNLFIDHLDGAINRYKRNKKFMFAVLFLDLDRFKVINDSLGHLAGDRMLVEIAKRLQINLRKGDTVARFGGDEFTILLEGINKIQDVLKIAEKIQHDISIPLSIGEGQEVFTSASIGIATSQTNYESPDELMRDADTAMYKAKAKGKGTHVLFNIDMHKRAKTELKLERDLRTAIKKKQFELYYQPIIDLKNHKLIGLEALIRWNHPTRGIVSPLHFIPFAEETGMIMTIGEWVLDEACRQRKAWLEQGFDDFYVAVNISALRFNDQDICNLLERTLQASDLDPKYLELEITEGKIMRDAEETISTMNELQKIGVRLSIDDFGTGYSSLAYLKRFPLHTVKIDRTFIKDVEKTDNDAAITKAIIAMAHNLNLKVIAEGVENKEQLEFLTDEGCDFVQGFYFSKPVPASQLAVILNDPTLKVG